MLTLPWPSHSRHEPIFRLLKLHQSISTWKLPNPQYDMSTSADSPLRNMPGCPSLKRSLRLLYFAYVLINRLMEQRAWVKFAQRTRNGRGIFLFRGSWREAETQHPLFTSAAGRAFQPLRCIFQLSGTVYSRTGAFFTSPRDLRRFRHAFQRPDATYIPFTRRHSPFWESGLVFLSKSFSFWRVRLLNVLNTPLEARLTDPIARYTNHRQYTNDSATAGGGAR